MTRSFKSYFRKSSEDHFWSLPSILLQIPCNDDTAASQTCSKPAAPVPASPSTRHLQHLFLHQRTSTGVSKPAADHSLAVDQIMQQDSCPRATTSTRTIVSTLRPHRHTPLGNQGLTKPGHRSSNLQKLQPIRSKLFCHRDFHQTQKLTSSKKKRTLQNRP